MRQAKVERITGETKIKLSLNLDGQGQLKGQSGIGFFDHMLSLFCRHGLFDLSLEVEGDLYIDDHHTIEDLGLTLGQAFQEALGDKTGICRYGTFFAPMDEALIMVSLDLSGRPYLVYQADPLPEKTGHFDTELVEEFLRAFTQKGGITLHVRRMAGQNSHHVIEAIFKALARALRQACAFDDRERGIPSSKGVL